MCEHSATHNKDASAEPCCEQPTTPEGKLPTCRFCGGTEIHFVAGVWDCESCGEGGPEAEMEAGDE